MKSPFSELPPDGSPFSPPAHGSGRKPSPAPGTPTLQDFLQSHDLSMLDTPLRFPMHAAFADYLAFRSCLSCGCCIGAAPDMASKSYLQLSSTHVEFVEVVREGCGVSTQRRSVPLRCVNLVGLSQDWQMRRYGLSAVLVQASGSPAPDIVARGVADPSQAHAAIRMAANLFHSQAAACTRAPQPDCIDGGGGRERPAVNPDLPPSADIFSTQMQHGVSGMLGPSTDYAVHMHSIGDRHEELCGLERDGLISPEERAEWCAAVLCADYEFPVMLRAAYDLKTRAKVTPDEYDRIRANLVAKMLHRGAQSPQ